MKKSDIPNDLILRVQGRRGGWCSATVSIGIRYRGEGALRFAPDGAKINASEYIGVVANTYFPDRHQLCGVPPTCAHQKDCASSHEANATHAYIASKFPRFWAKNAWPPNSHDLDPLGYFACGYVQAVVTNGTPGGLDTLKLAIRKSANALPPDMAQRAIDSFPRRVELRIQKEGAHSKTYAGVLRLS